MIALRFQTGGRRQTTKDEIEKWNQMIALRFQTGGETLDNQRGDRKMESIDSPEIPDRGKTSDNSGLPSGRQGHERLKHE